MAQVDPAAESTEDRKTRELLEGMMIDEFKFDEGTLETSLNLVRDKTGANMVVLWGAIEAAGIRRDKPVTQSLKHVTAAQWLKVILDSVSVENESDSRLGYVIENGIIKIAPRREFRNVTVEKTYDIRELLVEVPNFRDAPVFGFGDAVRSPGGGGENGVFQADAAVSESSSDAATGGELVQRIKEHIGAPSEWSDNLSVINADRGQLLVKTTRENHRAIAVFLADMRNKRSVTIALQARVLRMPAAEFEKLAAQTHGTLELDAAGVQALMTQANGWTNLQVLAAAGQRCMSGQRAYAVGTGQKAFVSDVGGTDAAENKEGKADGEAKATEAASAAKKEEDAMKQTLSTVQGGLVFDTQVAASADHQQVTAVLRVGFADVSSMRRVPVVGNQAVEVPELGNFQWRTTTTIPNGGAVLLTASTPAKDGQNAMETVLMLQATVVEPKGK